MLGKLYLYKFLMIIYLSSTNFLFAQQSKSILFETSYNNTEQQSQIFLYIEDKDSSLFQMPKSLVEKCSCKVLENNLSYHLPYLNSDEYFRNLPTLLCISKYENFIGFDYNIDNIFSEDEIFHLENRNEFSPVLLQYKSLNEDMESIKIPVVLKYNKWNGHTHSLLVKYENFYQGTVQFKEKKYLVNVFPYTAMGRVQLVEGADKDILFNKELISIDNSYWRINDY